ncbi:MAG TPA: Ig-like domain-containing protein, partial [Paludibacter sp.]|nr:Ig-like domain-containing protein [Paludibacter sp.]
MKKVLIFLLFFGSAEFLSAQIIADHSVVDSYDDIPEEWLNKVKQMLVWVPGMSHSLGYQNGVRLLALYDSRFASYIWNSDPPPSYSNSYLRLGRPYMSSVNFWTTDIGTYCGEMYKQQIAGNPYTAVINGWSYESTWNNPPGGGVDPVYNIHWAGDVGGLRWGLDAADQSLTGNPVCMDTYISAINTYNAYFSNHGMVTRAIFSTGVVDENAGTENGFQRELKNKHIRDYVNAHSGTILFDYADILVYSNNGERYQAAWNDNGSLRYHDQIHPENKLDYNASWAIVDENDADGDHIGEVGALRLAKALWWMLARIAGWDGGEGSVPVTGITVTGAGGASTITQNKGTLALTATVTPANATNKTVTWSIINGTGQATINSSGVVTAVSNGTVTARATANDGSGVYGQLVITISGQVIPVSGITVTGAGGASTITQNKGTLALTATVTPANATNKTVTWSIINGTGQATINSSGVVTAVSNGTVTARATANDGSGVYGQLVITISGQIIPVSGITVTGAGGASTISQNKGTLALTATVTPANATNKTVTWSIINGTGQATINSSGVVTAVSNGTVTARATANDGSGVYGQLVITISGQVIPVSGITVTGAGGASTITQDKGTLALSATVTPANATNKTVTWSINNGTGQATINSSGVVTAVSNGTVTARATAN